MRWSGAALTLLLGACSLAPPLKTPVVPTADAYKEIGPWTQAQPADRLPRDSWWTLYDNAELDELEKRLIAGNPTLAAALANYAQARALADQARAGLFPTLGLKRQRRARSRIDQRAAQGTHHADLLQRQHGRRQRQLRARPVGADSQRGRRGRGQRRRIRRGSRECAPVADRAAGRRLHSAAQPRPRQRDPR